MRQTSAVVALCAALAGCGLIPKDLTERFNRSQQQDSVDKPYTQAIKDRLYLRQEPIGTETLASGFRIIKHVGDFPEEPGQAIGPYREALNRVRVVYFLVDRDGMVQDWATVIHKAGKSRCWSSVCIDGAKQPPIDELDQVVRTSRGETLAAWRAGG